MNKVAVEALDSPPCLVPLVDFPANRDTPASKNPGEPRRKTRRPPQPASHEYIPATHDHHRKVICRPFRMKFDFPRQLGRHSFVGIQAYDPFIRKIQTEAEIPLIGEVREGAAMHRGPEFPGYSAGVVAAFGIENMDVLSPWNGPNAFGDVPLLVECQYEYRKTHVLQPTLPLADFTDAGSSCIVRNMARVW